jgi:hypothetical protein
MIRPSGKRWPRESGADTDDVDPVERCASGATWPSAAQQRHFVTAGGQSSENLVEVKLSTACLRILPVLPIDDEDPHD